MIRNVCAVVAGLIVGMLFNMVVVGVDFMLYPMPEGVDFEDTEGVAAYIKSLPLLALLIVLVAHLGQAFFDKAPHFSCQCIVAWAMFSFWVSEPFVVFDFDSGKAITAIACLVLNINIEGRSVSGIARIAASR